MRVAVIGAGPAGLFLGSALAGRGHDVVAVDRDPGPPPDGAWPAWSDTIRTTWKGWEPARATPWAAGAAVNDATAAAVATPATPASRVDDRERE